jgi:hypothetical protein
MDADSERAFEQFVRERSAALFRMAYLVKGDAHQAGDLLQSAFERAYRRWRRIRSMDLARDATAMFEDAQVQVAGVVGAVERLSFATGSVDRLLPETGSAVGLVDCGGRRQLAAAERAAVLGQVRAVVLAAAVVNAGVLEQTVGKLDLGATVRTPVAVTVTSRTSRSVVLTSSLGGGAVAPMGTVVTTVRLPDLKVTRVDLRGLDLGGLGVAALGLLPGLDLREGIQALPPSMSAVVAADVETVLP